MKEKLSKISDLCQYINTRPLRPHNLEQKKTLSDLIILQLKMIDFPQTLLTVEVVEIEKESYAKVVTQI